MKAFKRTAGFCAIASLAWSGLAFAQPGDTCAEFFLLAVTDPAYGACEGNVSAVPFDLLAPGARSLGLGGAFAAVADDATAAEANPAGQTILTRPEVSVHVRNASYDVRFFNPNQLDSVPPPDLPGYSPVGPGPIDRYRDSSTKVSFLSFVYPFERFVMSVFYQNSGALKADSQIVTVEPEFDDTFVAGSGVDVEAESFGLSGAFRISDLFSIGASIKHASLDLQSFSSSSVFDFRDLDFFFPNAGPYYDEITLGSRVYGTDHDITWNLGLLVNPNGKFSAGLVYKKGGDYKFNNQLYVIDVASCANASCADGNFIGAATRKQTISLPDVLSLGVAWRPSDTWLISAQLDRVDYGKLPDGSPTGFLFGSTQNPGTGISSLGTESVFHLGAEKTFLFDAPTLGMKLLSVRFGGFTDPDHDSYRALDTDDTHYTFGLGTVFGEKLQVDLGAEFSDRVDAVVASAVYHF